MELHYEMRREDYRAARVAANQRARSLHRVQLLPMLANIAVWTCIGFAAMTILHAGDREHQWFVHPRFVLALVAIAAFLIGAQGWWRGVRNRAMEESAIPFPVAQVVRLLPDGIFTEKRWGTVHHNWSMIVALRTLPE